MDFSNTLRGITIEGHSPLPRPPYFVFALKTFRSRSRVLANGGPTGNVFIACDPCAVDGTEQPRNSARRNRRGLEGLEKPAAHRVKERAQAPENRDAVQDDVEERLRRTAFETGIHEHELQPVRPVEQGSADQDEEE